MRRRGSRERREKEAGAAMNTKAQGNRGGRGLLDLNRLMPRAFLFRWFEPLCALFFPSFANSCSAFLDFYVKNDELSFSLTQVSCVVFFRLYK